MVKFMLGAVDGQPHLSLRTCSVRETEILVEQQPPQVVFVCDHAGLVINKSSLGSRDERLRVRADTLFHQAPIAPILSHTMY